MHGPKEQLHLGIGAIVAAIILAAVAIPVFVSTPSNVPNVILSPLFWPYTIAGLTVLIGLGLVATSKLAGTEPPDVDDVRGSERNAARLRLVSMSALMAASYFVMPKLGMVWTSMIAFVLTAFIIKTRHPITALASAIAIPLILYAFFAHIAGVAIPQGLLVRLP